MTVATLGLYAPDPYNTGITSVSGGSGLGATDLITYRALISSSFSGNTGGVLNFDNQSASGGGGNFPTGGTVGDSATAAISATYGVSQANTMQFYRPGSTSGSALDANNNNGTNVASGLSSGGGTDGYFGIQGSASFSLNFITPLTSFGLIHVVRSGNGQSTGTLTVHYSDATTATSGISNVTTVPQFVGFIAPSGKTIISLDWANSNSTSRFDDFGFTLPPATNVATGTIWQNLSGGSWDTPTNWSAGVPNASKAVCSFGDGTVALSGAATVDLPGTRTVGTVNFRDALRYTLSTTAAGTLALDNGTNAANVNVILGSHTIAVPVTLNAAGAVFNMTRFQDALTVTGNITGAGALTVSGSGTVILGGTSGYGATLISSGKLQVGQGGAGSTLSAGPVSIGPTGTLAFNHSSDEAIANVITGTNGTVQQDGTGTMTFSGANSFGTITGGLIINHGLVKNLGNGGIPSGVNVYANATGGTFDVNGISMTLGGLGGGVNGSVIDTADGPGVTALTLSPAGTLLTTFSGNMTSPTGRTFSVSKTNTGTVYLAGVNAITGNVVVSQGDLGMGNSQALGSDSIIIAPASGDLANPTNSRARLLLGAGVTVGNHVLVNGVNANSTGAITVPNGNDSATVQGTVDVGNGNVGNGSVFMGPTIAGSLTIAGPVNQLGTVPVSVAGGNVIFSGGTTTGVAKLNLNAGNISVGAENGLPSTALVDLSATGSTTVNLNGNNQTIAGMTRLSANFGAFTNNGGQATLTTTSSAGFTYAGNISGAINYVHAGTGNATLTGALTYAGDTSSTGGGVLNLALYRNVNVNVNATGAGSKVLLSANPSATTNVIAGEFNVANASGGGTVGIAATARPASKARILIVNNLNVDATGHIDPANNDLIIHGQSASDVTALAVAGNLRSSTAGTGTGPDLLAGLGIVANDDGMGGQLFATFDGQTVSGSDVLVKYTYLGDTDLNGFVDGNDLANLLAGKNGHLTGWVNGDTNYDGVVNGTDLNNLLASLGGQGASFDDSTHGAGAVPEPAGTGLTAVAAMGALLTRRRRGAAD